MQPQADIPFTRKLPALEELQGRPQWVCWRKEERQGKLTKVPYSAATGKRAQSDNPATWASHAQAVQALRMGTYHGIGYVFHRDYTGIDLDHCVKADGSLDSWAQVYLERLGSYAEYSPSKTGIHILVRGTIPSGIRRRVPGAPHPEAAIEMYCERRYFTVTGDHLDETPETIEACEALPIIHGEQTTPRQQHSSNAEPLRVATDADRGDEELLEKAMQAKNSATFRALWHGDTSGYASQSEAELALCNLLAFWTGKDANQMDRLFRRSALYREKWEQPARTGELYGQGTIRLAIANCAEVYNPLSKGKIIPFRRETAAAGDVRDIPLPETDVDFVLDCLHDGEEGDARLYAHLFRGQCVYDHTEKLWYEWHGHNWKPDETRHALLMASNHLASQYMAASAALSAEAARAEKQLDPDLLKQRLVDDPRVKRYEWLKATTGALIDRAKGLKTLRRAQAVLTYAQAYLSITSRQWDTNPWLFGTRGGVLDLKSGTLRPGQPEEYIRTIIPTAWRGIDAPAPRFEQYLREIFAEREDAERDELIAFVQRVLGNTVGAVSNDVIIASGKFTAPGSAKPHLCALQGKRIAWASETSKGARFDVGQVKFLTGGGDIPARQLYGRDYTFAPSHLLILLTNNKPHADAQDSAFWDRLCPILFNIRFVDHPAAPNERRKDRTLSYTLDAEASGILAWLVRGCLAWQEQGLSTPTSVLMARREYREEEDTLGQFLKECCMLAESSKTQGQRLYDHYREWTLANALRPMSGNAFGIEMKKRFAAKREEKGWFYSGIGIRDNGLYTSKNDMQSDESASQADAVPSTESTGNDQLSSDDTAPKACGGICSRKETGIQESSQEKVSPAAQEAGKGRLYPNQSGIQEGYSRSRQEHQEREVFYL